MNEIDPAVNEMHAPAAPVALDVLQINKVLREHEKVIAELRAENQALKGLEEGRAVTDEEIAKAFDVIKERSNASLLTTNPGEPKFALDPIFGFKSALTKQQKKAYRDLCKPISKAFDARHAILWAPTQIALKKAFKKKDRRLSTRNKLHKDGSPADVMLRVRVKATSKPGKGLKAAKPKQVAGSVPSAPNANPPASL